MSDGEAVVQPSPPESPPANPMNGKKAQRRWLLARAKPARGLMGVAAGCGIGGGLLQIAQAGLLAYLISAATMDGAGVESLLPAFIALAGVFVLRALLAWGMETAAVAASERVKQSLRRELFRKLAALGPVRTAEYQAGALAATVMEQVEALEGFYARYLPQLAIAMAVPLFILIAVFPVDWLAGAILLLTAPLIPVFMALVGMSAAARSREQMQTLSRMGGYFLDRIQGLATLKLFRQDRRERERIAEVSEEFRKRTMKVLRIAFLSSAVLEFFSSVAIAMLAIYIGFALLGFFEWGPAGDITLFAGLFILLLAPDFFQPLRQLAQHYHDRASALGAANEIATLLDRPVPPSPEQPQTIPGEGAPRLTLEGVSLHFPGRARPALSDFSLSVAPGERVALVGPSGVGKSTVINLLLGLVQPNSGKVSINGVDLTEADPDAIARTSAWLGQRAHIFHGTLRDNIRLARPDADDAAVRAAAERARVMEFAEAMPHGLDTAVGERGYGLSGGQAQRIALARAILSDARLLLLDEPTASLDPENERLVLEGITALAAQGRTVVIATHTTAGMAFAERTITMVPPPLPPDSPGQRNSAEAA